MRVTVRITGLAETKSALEAIPQAMRRKTLMQALRDGAEPIAITARSIVSVRSGDLRDSIVVSEEAKDINVGGAVPSDSATIYVGATLWRAHFQEFGTAHHRAYPFMRPAFDNQGVNAKKIIEVRLMDAIKRATRSGAFGIREKADERFGPAQRAPLGPTASISGPTAPNLGPGFTGTAGSGIKEKSKL
jgi:HK97 gp10 family phage protein